MIRHGYGLQIYHGQRNADGILTKYEGKWEKDQKHGHGVAVYKDGSIFTGNYKRDTFDGHGKFEWGYGHIYEGNFKDGLMDG